MKIPKLKFGDLIEIRWIDSFHPRTRTWYTESELLENIEGGATMTSIGYFVKEDSGYIFFCGDFSLEEENVTMYSRVMGIPKGCIKKIVKT